MTISAKLRKIIAAFDNVSSPGTPEEACAKSDDPKSGIVYEHNDEIVVVYQPAKSLQGKKLNQRTLRDKTKMKGRLVGILAGPLVLNLLRGARERGPSNKAKNRGEVPSRNVSQFGTLYHICSDITIRAPKKSFAFGEATPFYAFIKIKTEDLDKLLDDGPKKSSTQLEQLNRKRSEAPSNEDGTINKEGLSLSDLVQGLKEGVTAIGTAIGEQIEKADTAELDAQTNELLADLQAEEEEKRGTSTNDSDLSPTQREDTPPAIKRNLEAQIFLNNDIVTTGVQNATSVLDYYIEVLDDNDPPIEVTDIKGINLVDEMEKIGKLAEYFEDFKAMNDLGSGTENKVVRLRGLINFPVVPEEGENQGGVPQFTGFDDRSPFSEALRVDPAVAEIFEPEEDEVDGSFFRLTLPYDGREPSFKGSVESVVAAIIQHDYGNANIGLPPATKHPAYDELANIDGFPQAYDMLGGDLPVVYDSENLPPRFIKEIDITKEAKKQGLYGFGFPEGQAPELFYTIKYMTQEQIRNADGDDILVNQELNFANTRSASIPPQLLQMYIYEKVRQPGADKVKITIGDKIQPVLFETELDKIVADGDLEFDFRPPRFSGLGISPEVTEGESFGTENNGKNAFPGYTPTTWSILKNLKLINEELSKLGSGGATPWTEFLPKIFVPAVQITPDELTELCKKGTIERSEEVANRAAGKNNQDNGQPPKTEHEDKEVAKKVQKTQKEARVDPFAASRVKIKQQRKSALRETVEHSVTDALVTCNSGLVKQIKSLADVYKLLGRFDFSIMLGAMAKKLASDVLLQQAILNRLNEEGFLPEELATEFVRCGGEVSQALDILNDLVPSIFKALDDPNALKNAAFDGLEIGINFALPGLKIPLIPNLDIYGFIRLLIIKGIKAALIKILGALLQEAIQELLGCNGDSLLDSLIAKAAEGLDLDIDPDLFGSVKDGLNLDKLLPGGFDSESLLENLAFQVQSPADIVTFYDALSAALTGNDLRTMIYDTPISGQIYRTTRATADKVFGDGVMSDGILQAFFISLRAAIPASRFDALIPIRDGAVICDEGELNDAADQVMQNSRDMGINMEDLAAQFLDALCEAAEETNSLASLLRPGGLDKVLGDAVKNALENTETPDEIKNVQNQAAAVITQASTTSIKGSETFKRYLSGIQTKGPSMMDEFKFAAFKPTDFDGNGVPIEKYFIVGTEQNRQETRQRVGNEANVTYNLDTDTFVKSLGENRNLVLESSDMSITSGVLSIFDRGAEERLIARVIVGDDGDFFYSDLINDAGQNLMRASLNGQSMEDVLSSSPVQRLGNVEDKFSNEIALYLPSIDPDGPENYVQPFRQRVVDRTNIEKVMQGISDACMEVMPKNIMAGPLGILEKDKCLGAGQIVYAELLRFYFAVAHYTGAVNRRSSTYYLSDVDKVALQLIVDYLTRKIRAANSSDIITAVEKIADAMDYSPTRNRETFRPAGESLFADNKLKLFVYKCLSYFDAEDARSIFLHPDSNNDAEEDAAEYFPEGFTIGDGEDAQLIRPVDAQINKFVVPLEGIVAMQIIWASEYDLPGALGLKFEDFLRNARSLYGDAKAKLDQNTRGK